MTIPPISGDERYVDEKGHLTFEGQSLFEEMRREISRLMAGDYDLQVAQAERHVYRDYGHTVSVEEAARSFGKFGLTENADSGVVTTLAEFQGAVVNETFVSTNIIDSIVSSNAGDTQTITVSGYTIDANGNLTRVTQNATLNGQTEVTLATPLARATRAFVANSGTFNSPQAALAGTVSIYDNTDGIAAGVPNTAAATKLLIKGPPAVNTQTQKCADCTASDEYLFIDEMHTIVQKSGPTANVDFHIQYRDIANGGVWRPTGAKVPATEFNDVHYRPFLIIPPNHDIRVVGISDTANTFAACEIRGYYAKIV